MSQPFQTVENQAALRDADEKITHLKEEVELLRAQSEQQEKVGSHLEEVKNQVWNKALFNVQQVIVLVMKQNACKGGHSTECTALAADDIILSYTQWETATKLYNQ